MAPGLDPLRPRRIHGEFFCTSVLGFSPDGRLLAQSGMADTLVVLEVSSGAVRHVFPDKSRVRGSGGRIVFSPDGRKLSWWNRVPSGEGWLYLAELDTGRVRQVAEKGICWIEFATPGVLLRSGDDNGCEAIDAATERTLWSVPGLRAVALHGERLITVDARGQRMVELDALSGLVLAERSCPEAARVMHALADGRHVFCPETGPATLRGPGRADLLLCPTEEHRAGCGYLRHDCVCVTLSPDEELAAAVLSSQVVVWSTATGEILARLPEVHELGLAFSADGQLATGDGSDVLLWPLRARIARGAAPEVEERSVRARAFSIWEGRGRRGGTGDADWFEAEGDIRALAEARAIDRAHFSWDGRRVLSAHRFEALRTWEVESGSLLSVHRWHQQSFVAASPTLDRALFQGYQAVEHLELADRPCAQPTVRGWSPPGHENYRQEVAGCALDGGTIVVAARYVHLDSYVGDVFAVLWAWDPYSGRARELATTRAYSGLCLSVSERKERLLVGAVSGPTIEIRSTRDGRELWTHHASPENPGEYRRGVTHACWRADGEVCVALVDRDLLVIDVEHGGEPRRIARDVRGTPVFSASGCLLAMVDSRRVVVLDAGSGRMLREHREAGRILAARFADDERRLCVVHEEGPPFVPHFSTICL